MMARFKCYLESLSPHQKKKKNKNMLSELDPLWQNFQVPRMVAYIDDAHVDTTIVHED